ncbi:MAG: DUF4982 domain-containing protein [Planctomycetales bacterium]|nr:DUF4982 domain-containing protein [Planctomycetales bacterium]
MRISCSLPVLLLVCATQVFGGERSLLDEGWRFHLGDAPGAELVDYDDTQWRPVDLPHDWSTEHAPAEGEPSAGHGGYHRTGVGWYRSTLEVAEASTGSQFRLEFDGVYQDADIWLNGQKLGAHQYGYTPFWFDVTPHLKTGKGGKNIIAVRVDNSSQPNCRWYSGSGIYRHVWLRELSPVDFRPESLWVTTEKLDEGQAAINVRLAVRSASRERQACTLKFQLEDPVGKVQGSWDRQIEITAGGEEELSESFTVLSPQLWSAEHPHRYRLAATLVAGDSRVSVEQRIGIRQLEVSAEKGLLINDQPVILFGGCVHHDHGPLGAASFDMAEERRVRLLKAAGFNAIRTSHNPPSEAFLDACDELGMLVIDEAFDNWRKKKVENDYGQHFDAIWREELAAMVRRDRRHPSVIMWSIGNEVYERGEASGVQYAHELAGLTRSLDPTRPVTAGICGLWGAGDWPQLDPLFKELDVCGYNYETARYATDHVRLPDRVMYGSETYPVDAFEGWKAVTSQPWAIGDFVWTAMDYLGEAAIGRVFPPGVEARKHWEGEHFPWRGAACGDIDLLGRRKPMSHYRNIVWDRGERLYLAVEPFPAESGMWQLTPWAMPPCEDSWTWPASKGAKIRVHAYSRLPQVRLLLNGRVVEERTVGEEQKFYALFDIPYEPGDLVLEGLEGDVVVERKELVTAGDATRVDIEAEQSSVRAGRQSIAYLNVQLTDDQGRPQPLGAHAVEFSVTGPAEISAVGNADLTSLQPYRGTQFPTYQGRAQVILRSTGRPGLATVTARAEGLSAGHAEIEFTQEESE